MYQELALAYLGQFWRRALTNFQHGRRVSKCIVRKGYSQVPICLIGMYMVCSSILQETCNREFLELSSHGLGCSQEPLIYRNHLPSPYCTSSRKYSKISDLYAKSCDYGRIPKQDTTARTNSLSQFQKNSHPWPSFSSRGMPVLRARKTP